MFSISYFFSLLFVYLRINAYLCRRLQDKPAICVGGGKQILSFFLTKRPIIAVAESVHFDAFN